MPPQRQVVRYPTWLTAGIGVVVLLCIFVAFQSYRTVDADARTYRDPYMINAQPERVREAIAYLPDHAPVGYLSDLSLEATNGSAAYFGVMYALAPRLLTRSADTQEWVIGNFSHPLDYAAAGTPHHLELVKDFGNGIVLFCRRRQ
jgi:hypothetical protein